MTANFILSSDGATVDEQIIRPRDIIHNGVRHPKDALAKWTDAELAAIGVYRVNRATIPDGDVVDSLAYSPNLDGVTFDEVATTSTPSKGELALSARLDRVIFYSQIESAFDIADSEPDAEEFLIQQLEEERALKTGPENADSRLMIRKYVQLLNKRPPFMSYVNATDALDGANGPGYAVETIFATAFGMPLSRIRNLFLNNGQTINIDRANCPITAPLVSEVEALKARVVALETEVNGLLNL